MEHTHRDESSPRQAELKGRRQFNGDVHYHPVLIMQRNAGPGVKRMRRLSTQARGAQRARQASASGTFPPEEANLPACFFGPKCW